MKIKNKLLIVGALTFFIVSCMQSPPNDESNNSNQSKPSSLSPIDQITFENDDRKIYEEMCATENSYKHDKLDNQLSAHRSSLGRISDWFYIVSSVNNGAFDDDFKYDKSIFIIYAKSEYGFGIKIYIDHNDPQSEEIAKQLDNGRKIFASGDYKWAGMIAGFTLNNARIKSAD